MKKILTVEIDTLAEGGDFESNDLEMMFQAKRAFGALYDISNISKHDNSISIILEDLLKDYEDLPPEVLDFLKDGGGSSLVRSVILKIVSDIIEENRVDMDLYR